jgi:hypothetical protein
MGMNITAANATAVLTVNELFPEGIILQQFGTDQALSQDSIDITETRMGVDGKMVAGYTPNIMAVTVNLEASSPSRVSLAAVWEAMQTNMTIYECSLICDVPSLEQVYTWARGVMKSGVPFASLKKVLDPTTWVFHFEKLERASR